MMATLRTRSGAAGQSSLDAREGQAGLVRNLQFAEFLRYQACRAVFTEACLGDGIVPAERR